MHLIFIPYQTIPFLDLSLSVILLSFLDSLSILHEVNLFLIHIYLLFNPLYFPYNNRLLQPSLPLQSVPTQVDNLICVTSSRTAPPPRLGILIQIGYNPSKKPQCSAHHCFPHGSNTALLNIIWIFKVHQDQPCFLVALVWNVLLAFYSFWNMKMIYSWHQCSDCIWLVSRTHGSLTLKISCCCV
jgi:hypothetical protein